MNNSIFTAVTHSNFPCLATKRIPSSRMNPESIKRGNGGARISGGKGTGHVRLGHESPCMMVIFSFRSTERPDTDG